MFDKISEHIWELVGLAFVIAIAYSIIQSLFPFLPRLY